MGLTIDRAWPHVRLVVAVLRVRLVSIKGQRMAAVLVAGLTLLRAKTTDTRLC